MQTDNSNYPTYLTDEQWELLQLVLAPRWAPKIRGRPHADMCLMVNALLYFVRSGCDWRLLPKD
jgi:putative transposase